MNLINITLLMQVDISESKSRAFNIFLRFIQLSISIIIALYISQLDNTICDNSFFKLLIVVSVIMLIVSLLTILYNRCRAQFSKISFYILFSINLILAGIILVVSFAGYGQDNLCANNKVFYRFAVTEVIFLVVMTLLVMFLSFYWIQRYSNSPGNLTWIFLFFGFAWSNAFDSKMTTIGALSMIISSLTLLSNGIAAWKGITITVKSVVIFCWAVSLLLMFINEIVAIITYFQNSTTSDYNDVVGKRLLQTFLALNVIQFVFWLFGLMTLKYENGDPIRESLLAFGKNDHFVEEERQQKGQNNKGFGTIK